MREEFYRRAANGEGQIYSYRWKAAEPKAVVQFIHDKGDHAVWYEDFAESLADAGCDVYANDIIGHGMSRQGHQGCFGMKPDVFGCLVEDTRSLYLKASHKSGTGLPLILIGIGLGVNIALEYMTKYSADAMILIGVNSDPKLTVPVLAAARQHIRAHGYNSVSQAVHTMMLQLNRRPGAALEKSEYYWLSTDEEELRRYVEDPDCGFPLAASAYKEILEESVRFKRKKEYEHIENLPILILSGEEDQLGDCGAAPEKLTQRLRESGHNETELKLYRGCYHDILHDVCREQVISDIKEWLEHNRAAEQME